VDSSYLNTNVCKSESRKAKKAEACSSALVPPNLAANLELLNVIRAYLYGIH